MVIVINMSRKTTIQVGEDTREKLRKRGEKGVSFDEIIKKILEKTERQ